MKFHSRFALLVAVSAALPVSAAHAYLDPASVSIAIQAVVGAVAAYILTGKIYLQKIKRFFQRGKDSPTKTGDTAE